MSQYKILVYDLLRYFGQQGHGVSHVIRGAARVALITTLRSALTSDIRVSANDHVTDSDTPRDRANGVVMST